MSRLTDKITLMKNMTEDELKEYIKTLSDNDKNTLLLAFVKTFILNEGYGNRIDKIEE